MNFTIIMDVEYESLPHTIINKIPNISKSNSTGDDNYVVEIYSDPAKFTEDVSIKILYIDDYKYIYKGNNDVLVARSEQDVVDILKFYSKYDYKTLEKIK